MSHVEREYVKMPSEKKRIEQQTKYEAMFYGDSKGLEINKPKNSLMVYEPVAALITKVFSDLMFGGDQSKSPFVYTSTVDREMEYIDVFNKKHPLLDRMMHEAHMMASYMGDVVLEAYADPDSEGGEVSFVAVDPRYWVPTLNKRKTKYESHTIRRVLEKPGDDKSVYIHERTHYVGYISQRVFVAPAGNFDDPSRWNEVSLEMIGLSDADAQYETGVDMMLVYHIPNLKLPNRVYGLSDYIGKEGMMTAISQLSSHAQYALERNTNPKPIYPRDVMESIYNEMTDEYDDGPSSNLLDAVWFNKNYGYESFNVLTEDIETKGITRFVTWDANLSALFEQRKHLLDKLALYSEINPDVLGDVKDAQIPDSGVALKIKYARTLQAVYRRQRYWEPALKWLIQVMGALEGTQLTEVAVEWSSTLPEDVKETLEQMSIEKELGVKSMETMIKEYLVFKGYSNKEAEEELQRIEQENSRIQSEIPTTTPNIFEGEQPQLPERTQEV